MKPLNTFLVLGLLFFIQDISFAQDNRIYDGYYTYEWEIPKPPEGDKAQVSKNQGSITVTGNTVTFTLDVKFINKENPENDYTLYSLSGTGIASQTGDFTVTAEGSGSCVVYENGRKQDDIPFTLKLSGAFSVNGDYRYITGTISSVNVEGKVVNTFPLHATYKAESKTAPGEATTGFGSINGQVEVLFPGETEWQDAKPDMLMPPGTHIKTAMESTCILGFKDMTTFSMKPESEIEIADVTEDASKIKLVLGKLWANIKKMTKDGKMEIATTQAVAGIKGTTLVLETDGKQTTLKVIEGTVAFTSLQNGAAVDVNTGETVSAGTAGLSEKTKYDTEAESASWTNVKQTGESGKKEAGQSVNKLLPYILTGAGGLIFLLVAVQALRRRKK